jgi:protein-disulfide isomerase
VVVGVVLVAVILVVVVIWRGGAMAPDSTNPTSSVAASTTPFTAPHGDPAAGWIEVRADTVRPGALTVDEYVDYQCPICGFVNGLYGAPLAELAQRGDIILRVHLRTFLDSGLHNDSSNRAATAAVCADTVDAFLPYHEAVFADQPQEGVGYTDQQLRVDFPAKAGITGSDLAKFQQCYDQRQASSYVAAMESANAIPPASSGITDARQFGTPALFVNDVMFSYGQLVAINKDSTYTMTVNNTGDDLLAFLKQTAS